jgi:hypothetical protein
LRKYLREFAGQVNVTLQLSIQAYRVQALTLGGGARSNLKVVLYTPVLKAPSSRRTPNSLLVAGRNSYMGHNPIAICLQRNWRNFPFLVGTS